MFWTSPAGPVGSALLSAEPGGARHSGSGFRLSPILYGLFWLVLGVVHLRSVRKYWAIKAHRPLNDSERPHYDRIVASPFVSIPMGVGLIVWGVWDWFFR